MAFMGKMLEQTPSGYVVTPQTSAAVKTIKYNLGMKENKITAILLAGIPQMIIFAADDAQITGLLFEESQKKDRNKSKHREYAVRDFLTTFGDKAPVMSQAITAQTGANKADIYNVLGLFLPTFVDAIEEENLQNDEELAVLLRAEADKAKGGAVKK